MQSQPKNENECLLISFLSFSQEVYNSLRPQLCQVYKTIILISDPFNIAEVFDPVRYFLVFPPT